MSSIYKTTRIDYFSFACPSSFFSLVVIVVVQLVGISKRKVFFLLNLLHRLVVYRFDKNNDEFDFEIHFWLAHLLAQNNFVTNNKRKEILHISKKRWNEIHCKHLYIRNRLPNNIHVLFSTCSKLPKNAMSVMVDSGWWK